MRAFGTIWREERKGRDEPVAIDVLIRLAEPARVRLTAVDHVDGAVGAYLVSFGVYDVGDRSNFLKPGVVYGVSHG